MFLSPTLETARMPDADIIVATAWQTARHVAAQPSEKGVKFYFVQDYEYWATADPSVRASIGETFGLGMRHIATSGVVEGMLGEYGVRPVLQAPYGLDHETFWVSTAVEKRQVGSIGFPLRREPFKGTGDALEAARRLRERFGEKLRVSCFGSYRPDDLPAWIKTETCRTDDDLRRFYNSVSIFVLPSHYEGCGLPAMEAMACGAALVTADSGGVRDYAAQGDAAVLVPAGRPELLADAVADLIANDERRRILALRGREAMSRFHWETSVAALEKEFTTSIASSDTAEATVLR
jgi:glycosyltransferase involved in cell wall biosynthesis